VADGELYKKGEAVRRSIIHLRFALKEGWTEDKLVEVLLHLTGYVGVPIIREALLVASKVFAEVKAERAGKS